ncbi:hypothetical protein RAZWK3B_15528 [Roseobacter sp. AzwK-3b]|uniref:hypothetical protein n=1 Tax=Roseobacter sp. AzwK-3b TaxID=351016 RepID=UPI000156A4E5|nr:hypothetical protein [Roseobacter sp. AzwK-3b]EDM70821.1 hypothetical protein RAZWK3B_15528 [Roseobacter sp. AzwK-3b]
MTIMPIAIFHVDEAFASSLETEAAKDPIIKVQEPIIRSVLGTGQVYSCGSDELGQFDIVPLIHRDAPHHAAQVLSLPEMDVLLRIFCDYYGLTFKCAEELLADCAGADHELAAPETINWLSAFVDAYMDHDQYLHPRKESE